MAEINDGGAAFPRPMSEGAGLGGLRQTSHSQVGMTLRDYFAAMAMQGMAIHGGKFDEDSAKAAYDAADWMIKVRGAE